MDKLRQNGNYALKELWVLKAGKSASSVNKNDWTVYPATAGFTNREASASANRIYITDGTVIRLVYEETKGSYTNAADFYDYDAKYITDTSTSYIPARIPEDVQEQVRRLAVKVYSAIGCQGLSRVDFFVTFEGNRVVFNEINTLPGFTSISMYPKLWEATGIPYSRLIDQLLQLAVEAQK